MMKVNLMVFIVLGMALCNAASLTHDESERQVAQRLCISANVRNADGKIVLTEEQVKLLRQGRRLCPQPSAPAGCPCGCTDPQIANARCSGYNTNTCWVQYDKCPGAKATCCC